MIMPASTVVDLPVARVVAAHRNDRETFGESGLKQLADSIREHGLLQPITVQADGDKWRIIAGERRYRAHCLAGLDTIRAIVVDMTEREASAAMLIENIARVDLDPIAEGRAYRDRIETLGMTVAEVATMASKSETVIRSRLALLDLDPRVQDLVQKGQIASSWAVRTARLDANRVTIALQCATRPDVTFAVFDALITRLAAEQLNDDSALFTMTTEDYVIEAKAATRPGPKAMVDMLTALAEGRAGRSELTALLARLDIVVDDDAEPDWNTGDGTNADMVDIAEITSRLGVAAGTVAKWRQRGILPAETDVFGQAPVWSWSVIEKWAVDTGRLTV